MESDRRDVRKGVLRLRARVARSILSCAGLLLLSLRPLAAATLYVDVSKPCPGSGTQASPYCKIQSAICVSAAGDVVSVAPGTYLESIRMRPGVSVVSTGGYTVTTIDGTGKPCIQGPSSPPNPTTDYCVALSGSTQCSTVFIHKLFSQSDRLDGFTIKGGAGTNRSNESRKKIAGGGVFVLSDATISNNLITGNSLSGSQQYFFGGGIYINAAYPSYPLITRNTIDGNRAVPPAGSSNKNNFGEGGGIYSGSGAKSIIKNNIITNNVAAD